RCRFATAKRRAVARFVAVCDATSGRLHHGMCKCNMSSGKRRNCKVRSCRLRRQPKREPRPTCESWERPITARNEAAEAHGMVRKRRRKLLDEAHRRSAPPLHKLQIAPWGSAVHTLSNEQPTGDETSRRNCARTMRTEQRGLGVLQCHGLRRTFRSCSTKFRFSNALPKRRTPVSVPSNA